MIIKNEKTIYECAEIQIRIATINNEEYLLIYKKEKLFVMPYPKNFYKALEKYYNSNS